MSNVVKTDGTEPNNATTSNTFGKSVESQAQIHDAAQTSAPEVRGGETLNVYKLVPIAERDDPSWGTPLTMDRLSWRRERPAMPGSWHPAMNWTSWKSMRLRQTV